MGLRTPTVPQYGEGMRPVEGRQGSAARHPSRALYRQPAPSVCAVQGRPGGSEECLEPRLLLHSDREEAANAPPVQGNMLHPFKTAAARCHLFVFRFFLPNFAHYSPL